MKRYTPFTAQQCSAVLDQLLNAELGSAGRGTVSAEGVSVTWQSLTELTQSIRYWQGQLGKANGIAPAVAFRRKQ